MYLVEAKKELDQYIKIKQPNYAVEITGDWGIGKTFFIREYIDNLQKISSQRIIYLSLYGIKDDSEIEKKLWIQIVLSCFRGIENRAILCLFACCSILFIWIMAHTFTISVVFPYALHIIETTSLVLIAFALWIYGIMKKTILQIMLSNVDLIVFDDFERADMSYRRLLAYINHYVEHLKKHIVIVCNENEIHDKDAEEDNLSFLKIREKVIGLIIELEQNATQGMDALLKQGKANFKILNFITGLGESYKEYFFALSHPQECQVNYRVWTLCCMDFEKKFSGIDLKYFKNDSVIMGLLPNFFSLDYALRVNTFGENSKFTKEDAKRIYMKDYDGNVKEIGDIKEYYKWFYDYFAVKPESHNILPDSIWEDIIDDHFVDTKEIVRHWDLLLEKGQPLWLRLYNYSQKTDYEMNMIWIDLKKAYYLKQIQYPSQIVSIFSSVENMILTNCCLKVFKKQLTCERVLKLALRYIRQVSLSSKSDIRPIIGEVFSSCETYPHHACEPSVAGIFRKAFEQKCVEYDLNTVIPKRFDSFLEKLTYSEYRFDFYWHTDKLKEKNIFEGQSSTRLLEKFLELPPTLL